MHTANYRRDILQYLVERLGKSPMLTELLNRRETWSVGIAKFMHSPSNGLATHATIGLGERGLHFRDGQPFPGGIELLAVTNATTHNFEHCLAAMCFRAIETGRVCAPGDAYMDVVGQAVPGVTVPHLLVTDPFIWQQGEHTLDTCDCGGRRVHWVMVVPISDGELQLLRDQGEGALTTWMENYNVDVADLWRRSSV